MQLSVARSSVWIVINIALAYYTAHPSLSVHCNPQLAVQSWFDLQARESHVAELETIPVSENIWKVAAMQPCLLTPKNNARLRKRVTGRGSSIVAPQGCFVSELFHPSRS